MVRLFVRGPLWLSLITSQIDTAPKRNWRWAVLPRRLITSQIDTAPKLLEAFEETTDGLITSQIDTAPKPLPIALSHIQAFDYQSD